MAIPLEELRLGNWVFINNHYIHMDTRIFHAVLQGFDGYVPEPIVITEDILLNSGFKLVNKWYVFDKKINCHICCIRAGETFTATITGPFGMVNLASKIYTHQLQNLIFSLTGEELQIKL